MLKRDEPHLELKNGGNSENISPKIAGLMPSKIRIQDLQKTKPEDHTTEQKYF